jgi:phosphatidylglycerol lysyltransferase
MGQAISSIKAVMRHVIPLGIGIVCCWVLYQQLHHIDFSELWASLQSVAAWKWGLAFAFTGLSFWAVARYDVVAHRHFRTGVSCRHATMTGATAISIGQTVGAGALVGGFVRWKMIPNLGVVNAARITAFVTLAFLAAWAVITAASVLILPTAVVPASIPFSVLVISMGILAIGFFKPVLSRSGKTFELPTVSAMVTLLALCLIDTLAAAGALWILLPDTISLSLAQLFPIYLIALGAAILSGTPGGVGPFELAVLALLPHVPETQLMAAILAFRLVYYAVPAVIGGITLLRPMAREGVESHAQEVGDLDQTLTNRTARAELGVMRQNGGHILNCSTGICGVVRTGQTLTTIFDPVHSHSQDFLHQLRDIARKQNRIACKYKISGRHAVTARKAGWCVLHVSDEAMLAPAEHDMQGSAYRQLRRKLRNSEKAGVSIEQPKGALPFADMARVSKAWEDAHGGARGLSMGQFEEDYVTHQRIFMAYKDDALVGFVTFHATAHEWCLDLMRVTPDAPDGTMHRLVNEAILAAGEENVPSLSLAAAPALADGHGKVETYLRKKFFAKAGGKGLRQFKDCFKPQWQPLYMSAPGPAQLTFAALDLIRSVNQARPAAKPQMAPAVVTS